MNTTLMIKLDKKLRDDAKRVASELGVPLTTIVNAILRQFVRDKTFLISVYPTGMFAHMDEIRTVARRKKQKN